MPIRLNRRVPSCPIHPTTATSTLHSRGATEALHRLDFDKLKRIYLLSHLQPQSRESKYHSRPWQDKKTSRSSCGYVGHHNLEQAASASIDLGATRTQCLMTCCGGHPYAREITATIATAISNKICYVIEEKTSTRQRRSRSPTGQADRAGFHPRSCTTVVLQAPPCLLKILATELVSAIAIAGYGVARLVTQFGFSSRRIDSNGVEHLTTPSSSGGAGSFVSPAPPE